MAKFNLDLRFVKFLDILKKICIHIQNLGALKEERFYSKFVKEIPHKKNKLEDSSTMPIRETSSVVNQRKSPFQAAGPEESLYFIFD